MGHHSQTVAQATVNPVAQRALLLFPDCVEALAGNPFLADDVFAALYPNKKTSVARAKLMVTRNVLTDAQFEHLLAFETRGTVWNALLDHKFPGTERLTRLAQSKAFTRTTSDKIVAQFNAHLDDDWIRLAADKVAGRALLELWLRRPAEFTDQEISDRLRVHDTWGPAHPDAERITWLLAERPGVISGAAHSDNSRVRTWAAGCRHLTDVTDQLAAGALADAPAEAGREYSDKHVFQLLALANNPVVALDVVAKCHKHLIRSSEDDKRSSAQNRLDRHPFVVTKPFDVEDDPVKLAWLLRRCLPYDGRGGRWPDMKALLANPHLKEGEVAAIKGKLKGDLVHEGVLAEYNALVDRFPDLQDAWLEHQTPATDQTLSVPDREEPWQAVDDDQVDRAAEKYPANIRYDMAVMRYLERELADDEQAWAVALRTVDNGFTGTAGELVMVALASVAA